MLVQIRKAINQPIHLTFELFQLICLFHQHIFEDILRVARGGVVFAPGHSPIPLLIVPLKKGMMMAIIFYNVFKEFYFDNLLNIVRFLIFTI